jgi:predicted nuclease of predicted toxin-antitoxin system
VRFKIDQNLPVEIADALRTAGHDAETVYEENLAGTPDPNLATIIQREARGLVTLDLGFADIRTYPPAEYPGLIVMRPSTQDKPHVLHVFDSVVRHLAVEPVIGRLWIVEDHRIRVRE